MSAVLATDASPCRHCARPVHSYCRRGLCWSCFHNQDIRADYALADSPQAFVRVDLLGWTGGQRPEQPTLALPGTTAKILVMQGRATRHEILFHPADARGG